MEFIVRPYQKGEEKYVADAHKRIYEEEYHWGESFTAYAEKIALDFAQKEPGPLDWLWIAEDCTSHQPIGCIMMCAADEAGAAQLRLFLVEKAYRRFGVGSALTQTLLAKAKECGCQKLILWTASPLHDAVHHYERLGFAETERTENTSWSVEGKTVYEIKMEKLL